MNEDHNVILTGSICLTGGMPVYGRIVVDNRGGSRKSSHLSMSLLWD